MMEYLGGLSGEGTLVQQGKNIARAYYDFDGYLTQHAGVVCNGELRSSAGILGAIFALADLQLRTDDGRLLELQISSKTIDRLAEAVHVDVRGQLPEEKRKWRRRTKSLSA